MAYLSKRYVQIVKNPSKTIGYEKKFDNIYVMLQ